MPTILTPQGWVKVSDLPAKRRTVTVDPAEALKGPLAYFSCKRSPPKVLPGTLHLPAGVGGHGVGKVSREAFPYDLSASPEKLRAQGRVNSSQVEGVKIGGKNRTFSAPVPQLRVEVEDHYQSEEEERVSQKYSTRSSSPPPTPVSVPKSSRHSESKPKHHHKHRSHHHDDASSVSSRSTSSSTSSRSYRSHDRHRPMEAAPHPVIVYQTPGPAPVGPRYPGGMGAGYYNYPPPGSFESPRQAHPPPPSTGSARSMSYSWFNATTPLNL